MKRILSFLLCFIIVFSLSSCGKNEEKENLPDFELCNVKSPVCIHTVAQEDYMNDKKINSWNKYCSSKNDSFPAPLKLSFKWHGKDKPETFVVRVSENRSFTNCITERTEQHSVKIYNLKLNTKYYWYVTADYYTRKIESDVKSFYTADSMGRFIYCEGVTNMRDIGNYKTDSGKRVKQGMIYRSGRLTQDNSTAYKITTWGIEQMEELGIKTELDLRQPSEAAITLSVLREAQYKNIPIYGQFEKGTYFKENANQIKNIFELLADPANYPFIIHCSAGADRTGFVCYTISALLGVSKNDCQRDYLLTNFSLDVETSKRTLSYIKNDYVAGYDKFKGKTLSEKVENYLLSIGVTQEQIDSVRTIMLQ